MVVAVPVSAAAAAAGGSAAPLAEDDAELLGGLGLCDVCVRTCVCVRRASVRDPFEDGDEEDDDLKTLEVVVANPSPCCCWLSEDGAACEDNGRRDLSIPAPSLSSAA